MFPIYNQEEWVSIVATVEADSSYVSSTKSTYYSMRSTAALPTTSSTAGAHLAYAAFDPTTNKLKILYSVSS